MANVLNKLFGSRNERLLRRYDKLVSHAGKFEPEFESLDDAAFPAKTAELKKRVVPRPVE